MKKYIKDGKIYNPPIIIKAGGYTIYTTKEQQILAEGYEIYIPQVKKKTVEQLIQESNQRINKITDQKILTGFFWNEHFFYLSIENQIDFQTLYQIRNTPDMQIKIKTLDGSFYTFESPEQYEDFYFKAIFYVKECIAQGWREKAEAEEQIRRTYPNQ